ncbi:hypothetical protein [Saccharopolyspora griseoalba]|uniref:Uncharacterized protein n=1 Tax=Saccharopolyspora griseoalba TaxID=1431848 RepID=A0ABW2LQQ7_9PSEU
MSEVDALDATTLKRICHQLSHRSNELRRELPLDRSKWTDQDRIRNAQAEELDRQHATLWAALEEVLRGR